MRVRGLIALAVLLGGMSLSHAETRTRTSSFEYDPATGLLVSETIEPDQASLCLKTTYGYDSFGNKQTATTANCQAITGDPFIESRTSTTTFGSDGRFATSVTNALSHAETRQYDPKSGAVTVLTGPNNLTTTWEYDAFGRRKAENRSDGTRTEWNYVYCSGVNGGAGACPANGAYFVETTPRQGSAQSGAISKVYYDRLNREIRSETQGFNGVAVLKDTSYNSLGQVSQVSKPYYSGASPLWTVYTYDDVGRVATETQPGAGSGTVRAQTAYNGLSVTVTITNNGSGSGLPEGVAQTRTTLKNSQGQTASVTDAAGNVVSYLYDAFGNLRVTTAGGVNTVLSYDDRGRKIGMVDPDMGNWTYAYDALGQLKRQTDAKGQVTSMTYDKLGRMTSRAEPDLSSTWSYDACANGKGKLCVASSTNDYSRTYAYDGQGRASGVSTLIGTTTYAIGYTYDSNSRLYQTTYPNGFVTRNVYHATFGYLSSVTDGGATVYWQATSVSATGKVLGETLGNGLAQTRSYDALDRLTGSGVGNSLQSFSYAYDTIGNMTQRVDASQSNLTENFVYDRLNRLLQSNGTGLTTTTYGYNALGNITSKSDVGTYNYPTAGNYRPHAVSSITGTVNGVINPAFTYDANGSMTAGAGRTIAYTSFNMPAQITGNGYTYTYTYNPDHERVRLQHSTLGEFIYLHPAGKGQLLYERETKLNGVIEHKNYISAGSSLIGVYIQRSTGVNETRYFHTDHLGSVTLITNESGGVVERLAYDAFGKRRYPNGTNDPNNSLFGITTDRGFTGHEHLDEIALIHMNGRVFDPVLGRFMTADPFVQSSDNLQSYNRYSYVLNNPVMYTDPSGYFFKMLFAFAARPTYALSRYVSPQLAQAAVSVGSSWCGPFYAACVAAGSYEVARGAGASSGQALRGAAINGATALAFQAVGEATGFHNATSNDFLTPSHYANMVGHAAVGCASAAASGGSCRAGAFSGAAGSFIAPYTDQLGFTGGLAASMGIGGTASVIGGGKFANGAITAAYGYLYNQMGPDRSGESKSWGSYLPGTEAGANAAQYWADLHVQTGNPLYAVPGAFASLWTPDTAVETSFALLGGGGGSVGVRFGREISFGSNFRIAPFGNRTGHPLGELPHYHWRGIDAVTGKTIPGQGISRHRPWETKSTDRSFRDRF